MLDSGLRKSHVALRHWRMNKQAFMPDARHWSGCVGHKMYQKPTGH